jgi:protease I
MTTEQPGKRVAIVVADGFEQVELEAPRKALQDAGFVPEIVSPVSGKTVLGYHHADKGDAFPVDVPIGKAKAEDYAALVLPGGVANPDTLRQNPKVVDFVRHFFENGKPIAAICHGPWTLIDAGAVSGRKMTSWPSLKTDLVNAGAQWVDQSVVVDQGVVTSRKPDDLPDFCKAMLAELTAGPRRPAQELAFMARLGELLKDLGVAMLTTVDADGTLHSRPMVTQLGKADCTLWSFTAVDSGKSHEVAAESAVNLSYADPKSSRYVSVSGRAQVVRDRKKMEELWSPLVKAWFPKGLDDPDLGLLRVQIQGAEYWDAPAGKTVALLGIARSLLTGRPYEGEGAQHEKIELPVPPSSASGGAAQAAAEAAEKPASKPESQTEPKTEPGAASAPEPAAAQSEPSATQSEPRATQSEPAPTQSEPTATQSDAKAEPPEPKHEPAKPTSAPAAKPPAHKKAHKKSRH